MASFSSSNVNVVAAMRLLGGRGIAASAAGGGVDARTGSGSLPLSLRLSLSPSLSLSLSPDAPLLPSTPFTESAVD